MFRQDRYHRIEKSENNPERKDSTSSSFSALRGFRRALYGISGATEGESGSHAQNAWKKVEHLVKEENPRIVHSQGLRWKGSEAWDAKMREERWKGQEVPTKPSRKWKFAWYVGIVQRRLDKEKEQRKEQRRLDKENEQRQLKDAMKEGQ